MILVLVRNELDKVLKRKRTYISFILIGLLIPFIVGAIKSGGTTLEKSIYGQLSDSFFFYWISFKWIFGNLYNCSSFN